MLFHNIPSEMKVWPNWIFWKLEYEAGKEKPTKRPYNPRTGRYASVTNPADWCGFEELLAIWKCTTAYDGIGFVFTLEAGFTGVDFDQWSNNEEMQRQIAIYEKLNSYTERSPSGKGCHIIVKALTFKGVRKGPIEVYGSERYFTMTGDVVNNAPIADRTEEIEQLLLELKPTINIVNTPTDAPETQNDMELYEVAKKAANGDKFLELYNGNWQQFYQSQSEADFAIIDIIAYYTNNRDQVARVFRASALGKRSKAGREDYVYGMVDRAFDRKLKYVDIGALEQQFANEIGLGLAGKPSPTVNAVKADLGGHNSVRKGHTEGHTDASLTPNAKNTQAEKAPIYEDDEWLIDGMEAEQPDGMQVMNPDDFADFPLKQFPDGILGEVAQWIFDSAARPVREIALAGAIAFMAGVTGKGYNISNTGLNQYIFLLANTGSGKEAIANGIVKLFVATEKVMSATITDKKKLAMRYLGPSDIKSESALINYLADESCFVSIIGEFGVKIRQLTNDRATPNDMGLKRAFLDLYNKSGKGNVLGQTAYADKEKSTKIIEAPAFTLIGESEPSAFYGNLDESQVASGLLPRFLMIEYKGHRVPKNPNPLKEPPVSLVHKVASLVANCNSLDASNQIINVAMTPEAEILFDQFDRHADLQINSSKQSVIHHLWNRAHLKALKLAAVTAIGMNPFLPTITYEQAAWATRVIHDEVRSMIVKFDVGEIGELLVGKPIDEFKQIKSLQNVIKNLLNRQFVVAGDRQTLDMYKASIIPNSCIQQRVMNLTPFKNDKFGATAALAKTMKSLVDDDIIREVPKGQMLEKYGCSIKAWAIVNRRYFD